MKCSNAWLRQEIKKKLTILHCATGRIDAKSGHPELKPLRLISEHTVLRLLDAQDTELQDILDETMKYRAKHGFWRVRRELIQAMVGTEAKP